MNKELVKNFAIGVALLVLLSLILLAVESRGKMVESRFGLIGACNVHMIGPKN